MEIKAYSDIIGIIGVIIILLTYFLLQIEKISFKSFWYSFLNLIGSVLLLISLIFNWNLPSVIIEIFWMSISLFGIYKFLKSN